MPIGSELLLAINLKYSPGGLPSCRGEILP